MYTQIKAEVWKWRNSKEAIVKYNFFTKNRSYATYDKFLGINMSNIKYMINKYHKTITLNDLSKLIKSPYNEIRHLTLLFVKKMYHLDRNLYFKFLIRNIKYINNWNLVDCIASVFGYHSYHIKDSYLKPWIASSNPWKARLCIVALFYYIKQGDKKTPRKLLKRIQSNHQLVIKSIKWLTKKLT